MTIIDKSGKWWEARNAAGRKGSMYSVISFFFFFSFCPFLMKTDIFFYSCAFQLFTIANLTTTISFPSLCNGWTFPVSMCFFFSRSKGFIFHTSNPFLLRSSVIRQDTTLPMVHILRIQQAGFHDLTCMTTYVLVRLKRNPLY